MKYRAHLLVSAVALVASSMAWSAEPSANIALDADDIGGVVASDKGPEAGVWVVAETTDTPTRFTRIVVTDDRGRYVVPDLPSGSYQIFVRGYGLIDSKRVAAKPGQRVNLQAVIAPDAKAAAQVYPAAWWQSMMKLPSNPEEQKDFILTLKNCHDCHQLGSLATRTISPVHREGASSSVEAWDRRTEVGPAGPGMNAMFKTFDEHMTKFADWTDRVAKGDVPPTAPIRPAGVERNLVVTLWDWGSPKNGRTDAQASNPRNGTVNANGPIFGASEMTDTLTILDPRTNSVENVVVPTNAPTLVGGSSFPNPSPAWGPDVWKRASDPRSIAILPDGKVLFGMRLREQRPQPSYCGPQANNKYAKYFPIGLSSRQVGIYDPKTKNFEEIDTCFTSDHNMMDKDGNIYFGQPEAVGWVNIPDWNKNHNAEAAQGWCPAVIDTTGDGKISKPWSQPSEAVTNKEDHRIGFGCYSVSVNEKDGSLWCSGIGRGDRRLVRIERGSAPPETCKAEVYVPPKAETFGSGGSEITSDGVVWQNWRTTGELSAFDRTKCKSTNDPQANGEGCPEGWTFYENPSSKEPHFQNSRFRSTESYLTHVDSFNTLGLGEVPFYGLTDTDSFELLNRATGIFITLRVPYPLGFFPRSAGGRIDDAGAGWKGKGMWSTYSNYAGWHIEGGPGTLTKAVKFQMRPDPLAK